MTNLKIYPEVDETIIKKDGWMIFARQSEADNEEVYLCLELDDTFIDDVLDNLIVPHELYADFCKALDEFGLDYNKSKRKCINREGLKQEYLFSQQ